MPEVTTHLDSSQPLDDRVEALVDAMTLDEKLAQLGCVWSTQLADDDGFSREAADRLLANGTGQITRIAASTGLEADGIVGFVNDIQRYLVEETRLGIPAVVHEEAVAGFCARGATQFPQAIGLGATFDVELMAEIGEVIRTQMLAVGARHTLSPVLDIGRDPRWGRVEETYGEDPELAGQLGAAYVRAVQGGTDPDRLSDGVVCTGKHFLAYGLPDGGLNHGPVNLGPRELREVFAEPFSAAIRDAGLASMMNSYSSVDGLPCAGSPSILTGLLRDELGFEGTVVADYFSVDLIRTHHRVAADKGDAAAVALSAGLDVELPALDCYGQPAREAIESGDLDIALVDRALRRVLRQKFSLGLFDSPYADEQKVASAYHQPAHAALARRAAAGAVVVVKNDGVLPIGSPGRIAVIGPCADDVRLTQGDYHYPAHLEIIYGNAEVDLLPQAGGAFQPGPYFPDTVTPLAALHDALEGAEVVVTPGCSLTGDDVSGLPAAVDAAAGCDLALVFVGGRSGLTPDATVGEARDATDLRLTGVQEQLVEAVAATGTPTVAVVMSGRIHALRAVDACASALVLAWPGGEQAGAGLIDVLTGRAEPSGRLPVSLPRTTGQVPVHHNHRAGGGSSKFWHDYADGPVAPLYPFGHGLSYTTFQHSDLTVNSGSTEDLITVEVGVENSGDRAGIDVVPLFVRDDVASLARPDSSLVGFARVELDPGQRAAVRFEVHPSKLAFFNEDMTRVCEPGTFTFWTQTDRSNAASVDLGGSTTEYPQRSIVATSVQRVAD